MARVVKGARSRDRARTGKAGSAARSPARSTSSHGASTPGGAGSRPHASGPGYGDYGAGRQAAADSNAQRFGIDEANLATRREFIRLGAEERSLLAGLIPWARSVAADIAREFYDWQFEFGPTRRFFEKHAQDAGMPSAVAPGAGARAGRIPDPDL